METVSNLKHWNDSSVESMYDKTLLRMETQNILSWIPSGSSVCDVGCGEGEGTLEYSKIANVVGVDSSPVRLEFARKRCPDVAFKRCSVFDLEGEFDVVISQRLLVNLSCWEEQQRALIVLGKASKLVIISEGSIQGMENLNAFRLCMGLKPIPVPEHNVFIDESFLLNFTRSLGWKLKGCKTLGSYYLLTRGVQPALTDNLTWDSDFNLRSSKVDLPCSDRFSRVKQWAFIT